MSCFLPVLAIAAIVVVRADPVVLDQSIHGQLSIYNGLVNITFDSFGYLLSLSYGPIRNVFPVRPANATGLFLGGLTLGNPGNRAYYDWTGSNNVSGSSAVGNGYDRLKATAPVTIVLNTPERVVVSYSRKFNPTNAGFTIPCDLTGYFAVESGVSGVYSWLTMEHGATQADGAVGEIRFIARLDPSIFTYTYLSDTRFRQMPDWSDTTTDRSISTGILECRQITNPATNIDFTNEIDCKYYYLLPLKDQEVYGWVTNTSTPVGLWLVSPHKMEYTTGGPLKQDLTIQTGALLDNYFLSGHSGTQDIEFTKGTASQKMYGPWLMYLNSGSSSTSKDLWNDAKAQLAAERAKWPYKWAANINSALYPPAESRGTVSGTFIILDSFLDLTKIDMTVGWIGLSTFQGVSQFVDGTMNYAFWTNFASSGAFSIPYVRAGSYYLHAFVPGVLGEFVMDSQVTVGPGSQVNLGALYYRPPRSGRTVWEIGFPDRDSREFFCPVLNPLSPYPYAQSDPLNKHRNYGVWDVYSTTYNDTTSGLRYIVESSDYSKDWWYVHPALNLNGQWGPSTWKVFFNIYVTPPPNSYYMLRFALAGSELVALTISVGPSEFNTTQLLDTSGCNCAVGNQNSDNSMARGGSYGNYRYFSVKINSNYFHVGQNVIFFTQRRSGVSLISAMYDYIRLEGPVRN